MIAACRTDMLQHCKNIGRLPKSDEISGRFFYCYGKQFTPVTGICPRTTEDTVKSGLYAEEKRVLYFFMEHASHSKDYYNDFCDDEQGFCGLYDYVESILRDEEKQSADTIMNALAGIKMAINSDEQEKAFFEHSIDSITGLRYPALVDYLLQKFKKDSNEGG